MEDLTGKQLGPYQIVAPLGEGGMAAVYKAYQPAMDRYVALKVLPRHFASDPQFVARFQQEARVLAQLQHPHILPVFDFGEADGYTYIVMPFVKSGTLTDLLKGPALSLQQIRTHISQIGSALDYAHARGLIHRDVKPSNVLIDETGNCLLTDFGLAKIMEGSIHLTTSGAIMGTPAYMSPEQGLGHKIDKRSDIYALGVILYEMAVGRVPYSAETPMAVVIKHINDPLPPPHTVKPDLPETLERVILKALSKNPEDRFASAGEMVRALQAAIPEITIAAAPLEAAPRVEEPIAGETVKQPAPPPVKTEQAAPVEPIPAETVKPAVPPVAPPTRVAAPKPMWQSILITTLGFLVGVGLGLPFASVFIPLGGLVAGAVGGLSMGWAWRRMEPTVSRGRMFTLAGIWAIVGAIAVLTGPGFFVVLAVAGWLTGWVMRRTQPAMTRRDVVIVGLGWGLSWLIGGVMFAVGTQVGPRPLSGVIVVLAIALAGGVGSGIMFRQYRAARDRTLAPSERAKSKVPRWVYMIAAVVILACVGAVVVIGGKAVNDRRATQTAAAVAGLPAKTPSPLSTPTSAPLPTTAAPSPTSAASSITSSGAVKVVSDLPMTGSSLSQSQSIVNAIQQAFEDKNYTACNGAWTIEYEAKDDASAARGNWDPEVVTANANAYAADPTLVAVIGPYNSGAAKLMIPILNPANLILISPSNTYPGLTRAVAGVTQDGEPDQYYPNGHRNYVRVVPSDDTQGAADALWASGFGATSVYILDDGDTYGKGIADSFRLKAEALGLTVQGRESIEGQALSYKALAAQIKSLNPDLIFLGMITQNNAGQLIRDLRSAGYTGRLLGADGILNSALIEAAGNTAEGVYASFSGVTPDTMTGSAAEWRDAYQAKYGSTPEVYAAYGYVSVQALLDAFERVCASGKLLTDRAAVRDAVLATQNLDTVLGSLTFNAEGDVPDTPISGLQVKGGHWQFVTWLYADTDWAIAFEYRIPLGTWSAGTHTYTLDLSCPHIPDSFGNTVNRWTKTFNVSKRAPLLPGDVYLRLGGVRDAPTGGQPVESINPAQPTVARLMLIAIPKSQAELAAADCQITMSRDGGAPVTLTAGTPYQP